MDGRQILAAGFVAARHDVLTTLRESSFAADDPAATQVLVETCVPGADVALEPVLLDGVLTPAAWFDTPDPLNGPYFEETLYVTPSRPPADTPALITETSARAAAALGLQTGPWA